MRESLSFNILLYVASKRLVRTCSILHTPSSTPAVPLCTAYILHVLASAPSHDRFVCTIHKLQVYCSSFYLSCVFFTVSPHSLVESRRKTHRYHQSSNKPSFLAFAYTLLTDRHHDDSTRNHSSLCHTLEAKPTASLQDAPPSRSFLSSSSSSRANALLLCFLLLVVVIKGTHPSRNQGRKQRPSRCPPGRKVIGTNLR